jgi:hypothetical protein
MVDDWARAREANPAGRIVMLSDASNDELDRLNALAQQRRVAAGELGHRPAARPALRPGCRRRDRPDRSALATRRPRVANGTRATVQSVSDRTDVVVMRTDEPQPRSVGFSTREFRDVRLAYARHV